MKRVQNAARAEATWVHYSRVLWLFTIAVLAIVLTACSNDLSRSSAQSKIEKSLDFEQSPELHARIGTVGAQCYEYAINPDKDEELLFLRDLGILELKKLNKTLWQVSLTDKGNQLFKRIRQEPYGGKVENGCDYKQINLPLVSREMIGVTGIRREGSKSFAEFRWKWVPTEFGRMLFEDSPEYNSLTAEQKQRLKDTIEGYGRIDLRVSGIDRSILLTDVPIDQFHSQTSSTAVFRLYDDGWRLD